MTVLCIVPARGGSKRLPGKNLTDLGGKPLLTWTLEVARQSGIFNHVVVTSDDDDILQVADDFWGSKIGWKRQADLARDDTPMLPVVYNIHQHFHCPVVVTLQPTSPFRTADDIRASYELLMEKQADAVFSVTSAPEDLVFVVGHAQRLRQVPDVVVPNGALFLITGQALDEGRSWFNADVTYGYPMPKDRSLDIDTPLDMEIARMIAGTRRAA